MYRAVVSQQAKESEAGEETRGDDLWTYYTTVIIIIPNQKYKAFFLHFNLQTLT